MDTYAIVPRREGYWIQRVSDGQRTLIERYDSEAVAVERLHVLQRTAKTLEHPGTAPPAKKGGP